MPRFLKRSASQAVKSGPFAPRGPPSELRPSPTFPAGREAAVGGAMAARNQTRRLPNSCAHRERSRPTAHPHRARLDRQISERHRRTREPERKDRLYRRRTLWRRRRWFAELRPDAGGDRWRARRAARLLRFRSEGRGVLSLRLTDRKALLEPLVANKPGLQHKRP